MKKILYLVSEDRYFCSHRLELAAFVKQQGYEVAVATKCSNGQTKYKEIIEKQQIKLFELKFFCRANYLNPIQEFLALKELYKIYKRFKPDVVHHVALKPVIYGTIIAHIVKVKEIVNALAGLGFVFTSAKYKFWLKNVLLNLKRTILKFFIAKILRLVFNNKHNNKILLLQNQDDLTLLQQQVNFINLNVKTLIIPGSGIITDRYFSVQPLDFSKFNNVVKVVLVSRLLWTKGIGEFAIAAKQIKNYIKRNNLTITAEFILYGDVDPKNPASIDYETINEWQQEGIIIWKNFCHDIINAYRDCHIAVLPSYREGLPKSLLEAALCARAIVTTDVPGCREIVEHGVNGYLVPKQNSEALVDAILGLMQDQNLMSKMGVLGREKAINKFSAQTVFPKMLELYGC